MAIATPIRIAADGMGAPECGAIALEPLYTPQQVAGYLKMDPSHIRRLFADLPGVIKIGRPAARGGRRSYCQLRISHSVLEVWLAERIHRSTRTAPLGRRP